MKKIENLRLATIVSILFAAALSRLLPHPYNFTPIGAIALFGGAYFSRKLFAFIIPLGALLISDALIGFHDAMYSVYGSFILIVVLGMGILKKVTIWRLMGSAILSSILFFLITNFAVWYGSPDFYPPTFAGLGTCYLAGIQFYQQNIFGNLFFNTVMGDLFYTSLLFGAYKILTSKVFTPKMA